MSVIRIMTNFNIELEFPAAPFHRRLFAWILDIIILILYGWLAVGVIDWFDKNVGGRTASIVFIILLLPLLTYHLICEATMNGQSFGKRLMGIRVVNENGGQPGIGQLTVRWLIRTSDIMAFALLLSVASAAARGDTRFFWQVAIPLGLFMCDVVLVNASRKQQRLGDMLAHTLLIKASQKHSIQDTVFLNIAETYKPSFPQVMQLSDRDMKSLKSILDTAKKRGDFNLAAMASDKIKNHLHIETTLSPFDFLEILLKDYNYLSAN
ncbi:MAG: RDD family protein [Flavisolibacter sp.]